MTVYSGTQDFEGATFVRTSFRGATMRSSDVSGVTMRSVEVSGLDIDSHDLFFGSLIVNGVYVVPFVDVELNRQFPGRELQKAQMPEGLRDAHLEPNPHRHRSGSAIRSCRTYHAWNGHPCKGSDDHRRTREHSA